MERPSTTTGFVSSLMTVFVVTVMSLLVWVYAESRTSKPIAPVQSDNLPAGSPIQTFELATVPVVLTVRPEDAKRYSMTVDEADKVLNGLTLSGPSWLVSQVLPLSQTIRAYVDVTPEAIAAARDGRMLIEPTFRGVPTGLTVSGGRPIPVGIKPIE